MLVVGILRGTSKKTNSPFTVLHVIKDFDDYQLEFCDGQSTDNLYVKGFLDVEVGDEIEPVYGVGYQGKAIVTSINILNNKEDEQ